MPLLERTRHLGAIARTVLAESLGSWREHRVVRLGAGLAYYGLFAVVPVLAVATLLASMLYDEAQVQDFLTGRLTGLLGQDVDVHAVTEAVSRSIDTSNVRLGLGIVSVITLLFGASLVFLAFQDALNVIFGAPPRSGLESSLRRRLVAFGVVALTGVVLVASLAVQTLAGLVEALVPGTGSPFDPLVGTLVSGVSFTLGTLLLALLFRILPFERVAWPDALVGAVSAACLLVVGAWGFGIYIRHVGEHSIGGAAGGIAVALLFIYVEAQIVLGAAVVTKALHDRRTRMPTVPTRGDPRSPSARPGTGKSGNRARRPRKR